MILKQDSLNNMQVKIVNILSNSFRVGDDWTTIIDSGDGRKPTYW